MKDGNGVIDERSLPFGKDVTGPTTYMPLFGHKAASKFSVLIEHQLFVHDFQHNFT
jgi:hypothetical protein